MLFRSPEWTLRERLNGERDTLGLFITGHPFDEYEAEVRRFVSTKIVDVEPNAAPQKIAGMVVDMRVMKNKRGDSMCFITMDDRSGRIEVALFADAYNEFFQLVEKDKLLIVEVNVSNDEYSGGLKSICRSVKDIDQARVHYARALRLQVDGEKYDETLCDELKEIGRAHV